MGVLKRSSAPMIVLLLFLASLPGAKSVQHENEQSRGGLLRRIRNVFRSPPVEKPEVCDISAPNFKDVKMLYFPDGQVTSIPTPDWVTKQAENALHKESDDAKAMTAVTWAAERIRGNICTREMSVKEITKKGDAIIEKDHSTYTRIVKRNFHEIVKAALVFNSLANWEKTLYCGIPNKLFAKYERACQKVAGLEGWTNEIPGCKGFKNRWCERFTRELFGRKPLLTNTKEMRVFEAAMNSPKTYLLRSI